MMMMKSWTLRELLCRRGYEKSRFSTSVWLYLRNDTRYAHRYNKTSGWWSWDDGSWEHVNVSDECLSWCRCSVLRSRPVYGDCPSLSSDVRCWRCSSFRAWSTPRVAPRPPRRRRLVYGRLRPVRRCRGPRVRRQHGDAAVRARRARPGSHRPPRLRLRVAGRPVRDGYRGDALRHAAARRGGPAAGVSVEPGRATDEGNTGQDDVWRNGDQSVCCGRRHWTVCSLYYWLP